ncbi:MAG TPA: class I SAM-dependent methyltransferase [Candidatus Limnocylindrales bacterium]|nr:class I SAM-dependent methyltransferase [Candidatus Limnocylindrales bacterium]
MDRDDPAYRGQADYTPRLLAAYDRVVIGFVAEFVWQTPLEPIMKGYRELIRDDHLDVGPGTGWFIERSSLPDGSKVTLLDPNPNVLRHASGKLKRLDVTTVEADVLKPLPVTGPFQSAALNLVIHCLPGPMSRKALAIQHIAAVLAPTGRFFGATVLGRSAEHSWRARRVLTLFNWHGGFDNLDDSEEGLREILEASFEEVEIEIAGSAAVFRATGPKSTTDRATRP